MANTNCLTAISFSLTGNVTLPDQHAVFLLAFDSEADQETVLAYEWYLDGTVIIAQNQPGLDALIACGSHTVAARVLTAEGWSGLKSLAFQTCVTPEVTLSIMGIDPVAQNVSADYRLVADYPDGSEQDLSAQYIFSSEGGTFTGTVFRPSANVFHQQWRYTTLVAQKGGADPVTRQIGISDTAYDAGILVVELSGNASLDVIGLVDNAEVTGNHVAAYTGNNVVPGGAAVTDALVLASDAMAPGGSNWRFEFNIAKLLAAYPDTADFVFYLKGRAAAAGPVSGSFLLKTSDAVLSMDGTPGSLVPGTVGGYDFSPVVNFTSDLVDGADGDYDEAGLTMIVRLNYNVATKVISYNVRHNPIVTGDFDFMVVSYRWGPADGRDLDTLTGFENTGTSVDGMYVGYSQNLVVPETSTSFDTAYLYWGTDNKTDNGTEAILIGIRKFVHDFTSAPDVIEVGLYAVWFQYALSGDITVELVTYKGGTMELNGTDFTNSGGTLVSSNLVVVNTKVTNDGLHTPANSYKVGSLKYTRSTQSGVIVIN
ncbi:hypothetical protein KXD93_22475 [Mucilaginibacter sp. BJC16-A38]|uniref:hypothetical protein n=1 Tax=Mucilaginibacter phenanthrenivorans TaxID=1234842 RepID=UPI002157832A|nr:hypothetical protein [Mucilaginibacter phenanthrenivorans]MCR8560437.1 hypothetical protein [Mucilaginibacter phenanthrenivorans]